MNDVIEKAKEAGLWEQRDGVWMAIGGEAELSRFAELLRRTQPEATAPAQKLTLENAPIGTKAPATMGGAWTRTELGWKWDGGSTFPRPGGDWNGELIAPAQDMSAAILAIKLPDPQCYEYGGREPTAYSAKQMRDLLKAAAALASSANALSAGGRVDAITDTQRIDHIEAWSTSNKVRGMHWNTFCFDVDSTVREQLDAAILQSQKGNKV